MIKFVKLINFQGHKDTYIEFDKGTNAILGNTDAGKSTLFRAINWVAFNKPSGKNYPSHWDTEKECLVEIGLDNGVSVFKGRDKTGNYYRLSTHEGDFRAIGSGEPPKEIQQALNLIPINIQSQLSAPFLLSEKPGKVAQMLNEVMDLDIIDHAIAQAKLLKTRAASDLKTEKVILLKIENSLEEYSYLEEMSSEVSLLETLIWKTKDLDEKNQSLNKLIIDIKENHTIINKAQIHVIFEKPINDIFILIEAYNKCEGKNKQLENSIQNIKQKTRIIDRNKKIIYFKKEIDKILNDVKKLNQMKKELEPLKNLIQRIKTAEKNKEEKETKYWKTQKKYKEKCPKECPFCGKEMKQ